MAAPQQTILQRLSEFIDPTQFALGGTWGAAEGGHGCLAGASPISKTSARPSHCHDVAVLDASGGDYAWPAPCCPRRGGCISTVRCIVWYRLWPNHFGGAASSSIITPHYTLMIVRLGRRTPSRVHRRQDCGVHRWLDMHHESALRPNLVSGATHADLCRLATSSGCPRSLGRTMPAQQSPRQRPSNRHHAWLTRWWCIRPMEHQRRLSTQRGDWSAE